MQTEGGLWELIITSSITILEVIRTAAVEYFVSDTVAGKVNMIEVLD